MRQKPGQDLISTRDGLAARKEDHLSLCLGGPVEHRGSTLLEEVRLLHQALPEATADEPDLTSDFLGKSLRVPLLISGMTGGTETAAAVNAALARLARRHGLAMGVGSQRIMLDDEARRASFQVRRLAPEIPLLANLGAVQLRDRGFGAARTLVDEIEADALCIHLNPAQELVQENGDRDFRGCLAAIGEAVEQLPVPVVVKETGCGISPQVARQLASVGVTWVDVAGSGGTSWTRVEALRGSIRQQALGAALADWGIPTAASLGFARGYGLRLIASGGLRDGIDVARGIALGAELGAMALPFLQAFARGGEDELDALVDRTRAQLLAACVLTGSADLDALRHAPKALGPNLRAWLALDDGPPRTGPRTDGPDPTEPAPPFLEREGLDSRTSCNTHVEGEPMRSSQREEVWSSLSSSSD